MNDILNCDISNNVDANGNPTGGQVSGIGLNIRWQDGPLGRGTDRKEPNGAFVETGIAAIKQRLEFYQEAAGGKFACEENAMAIAFLGDALNWLHKRTLAREERAVEGTHAV